MGQKNNILIKRKECMAPQAMNDDESLGSITSRCSGK